MLPAERSRKSARPSRSLKVAKLLAGYRGKPAGDIDAFVETVLTVQRLSHSPTSRKLLAELDVNPVMVRPSGKGAVAVDALIRLAEKKPMTDDPVPHRPQRRRAGGYARAQRPTRSTAVTSRACSAKPLPASATIPNCASPSSPPARQPAFLFRRLGRKAVAAEEPASRRMPTTGIGGFGEHAGAAEPEQAGHRGRQRNVCGRRVRDRLVRRPDHRRRSMRASRCRRSRPAHWPTPPR